MANLSSFGLLAIALGFNVIGQLMLKRASLAGGAGVMPLDIFLSGWFVGGGASLGISMVLWVQVLRRLPLTIAHPISGAVFFIIPVASHFLWDEPMPPVRLLGILIIVIGIALVARGSV